MKAAVEINNLLKLAEQSEIGGAYVIGAAVRRERHRCLNGVLRSLIHDRASGTESVR